MSDPVADPLADPSADSCADPLAPCPESASSGATLGATALVGGDQGAVPALALENSFTRLPGEFYTRLLPTPLADPYLVGASAMAARLIGLDVETLAQPQVLAVFAGNAPLPGGEPHAAVYSGHQFGVWAGQLGDGRAITLGEARHEADRWEIQLKGAGLTPYSRMGDGRAVLRSSIREFLCSEAMAALGVPTTRALCVIGSRAPVVRETVETAAVVTRLAPSFVRFGSFEHWYHRDRPEALALLADHVIAGHYPEIGPGPGRYRALLEAVVLRTARLVAHWQALGFCHGVMNTDNMSILGLTLDYGPFGFMEAFDAGHICNHSDDAGRYAYARQPQVAHWNLYALGQALVPLIGSVEETRAALEPFEGVFEAAMAEHLGRKLGLAAPTGPGDAPLVDGLFALLQQNHADFTLFFRRLCDLKQADPKADGPLRDLFLEPAAFDAWAALYRARLAQDGGEDAGRQARMRAVNPRYVLRNYLAEVAIQHARNQDFSELAKLQKVLERPYDEQPENAAYAAPAPEWAAGLEVSCSS